MIFGGFGRGDKSSTSPTETLYSNSFFLALTSSIQPPNKKSFILGGIGIPVFSCICSLIMIFFPSSETMPYVSIELLSFNLAIFIFYHLWVNIAVETSSILQKPYLTNCIMVPIFSFDTKDSDKPLS